MIFLWDFMRPNMWANELSERKEEKNLIFKEKKMLFKKNPYPKSH